MAENNTPTWDREPETFFSLKFDIPKAEIEKVVRLGPCKLVSYNNIEAPVELPVAGRQIPGKLLFAADPVPGNPTLNRAYRDLTGSAGSGPHIGFTCLLWPKLNLDELIREIIRSDDFGFNVIDFVVLYCGVYWRLPVHAGNQDGSEYHDKGKEHGHQTIS